MKKSISLRFNPTDMIRWKAFAGLREYTLTRFLEVAAEDFIARNTATDAEIRQERERQERDRLPHD